MELENVTESHMLKFIFLQEETSKCPGVFGGGMGELGDSGRRETRANSKTVTCADKQAEALSQMHGFILSKQKIPPSALIF